MHLFLNGTLSRSNWDVVYGLTNCVFEVIHESVRVRHEIKYGRDQPDEKYSQVQRNQNTDKTADNISNWQPNDIEKAVLFSVLS